MTKKRTLQAPAFLALIFITSCMQTFAQKEVSQAPDRWTAGKVIHYQNNWVEVIVGDMPIVISVPHGGFMKPDMIADRTCKVSTEGTTVSVTDSKTIETARAIEQAFLEKYHKRPYIIISNIARTKVDQNRPINLAACGDSLAEIAWNDFHNSIDTALAIITKEAGFALYIDLHGHGHKIQRLELGYALDGSQVADAWTQTELAKQYGESSSLQNLLMQPGKDFKQLVWGKDAFGTVMQQEGIAAVPSMQDPHPLEDEKYFSGGYNTRRYTSAGYPGVFGWQIECNFKGVRDTEDSRRGFAEAFVTAYDTFVKAHLF